MNPAPAGATRAVSRAGSLRQLELLVTRRLDGLLQGDHRGLVPGGGTEPADGRAYQPGDDVRRMDWNLTARLGDAHVRTTVADRELETWLLVDTSASLDFGTASCEKRDLVLAAAATFSFLTARDGNRLGAVLAPSGGAEAGRPVVVAPRAGRNAVLALLHRLEGRGRAPQGAPSLAASIRQLRLAARRRGLAVVISDLMDGGPWGHELRALAGHHEVVVVEITDPREAELPAVGFLSLVDPETGRRLEVQTGDPRVRERFAAAAAAQRAERARAVLGAGAGHLVLSTDRDWLLDVVRFVAARRRRR